MTSNEQRKLLLELFYLKPGLNLPEKFEASEASRIAIYNELKALQRNNEQLQEQIASLKARNAELEDYSHTVAHDLKDPLSVIIVTCDAVTEISDLTPKELKEYLQQIRSTAYEMNDTIDNLLLLSEIRKVDIPSAPLDMEKIVENVSKRLNHMVKEYQGSILLPKTWPTAIGYAPWVEEAWVNYVSNALKYGGRPPVVRLGASLHLDGMVSFWVLDNGLGIPEEVQKRLFSPGNQSSQVYKPGHGLGLSIVRHIVEKLGGKVGVESKAGKGSLFYFSLPASQIKIEVISDKKTRQKKREPIIDRRGEVFS